MSENEQVHPWPWNQTRGAGPHEHDEQVYEFQPPKPYHPQQRFGSGVQSAALAYPNLAQYYGTDFAANFTTMDLLDSLAARVALMESQPHADMYEALRSISLTSEPAREMHWWQRVLYKVQGRTK